MEKIFRFFAHTHSSVTKFWMSTVFAVYWLNWFSLSAHSGKNAELEPLVSSLKKEFFYLGLICILIYEFAGFGNALSLRSTMRKEGDKWIPPAMSPLRKKLKVLTITYLLILFLFGGRIYWQLSSVPGSGMRILFLLLIISWAVAVFLFGLIEHSLLTHVDNLGKENVQKYRKLWFRTVRIMHIVLLSILGAGIYWQYTLTFR